MLIQDYLNQCIKDQGVVPISDTRMLLGGWPGDVDDGFEEWVVQSREGEIKVEELDPYYTKKQAKREEMAPWLAVMIIITLGLCVIWAGVELVKWIF